MHIVYNCLRFNGSVRDTLMNSTMPIVSTISLTDILDGIFLWLILGFVSRILRHVKNAKFSGYNFDDLHNFL